MNVIHGGISGVEVLARKWYGGELINPFAESYLCLFSQKERTDIFKCLLTASVREVMASEIPTSSQGGRSFFVSYNIETYFLKYYLHDLIDSAIKLREKNITMLVEFVEYDDFLCGNIFSRVKELKKYCEIALDDFSTKHSSFTLLCYVEPSYIKIDRSFLSFNKDPSGVRKNLEAIRLLCEHLDIKLIVEGVETLSQVWVLDDAGISLRQGYFYHRPMPLINFFDIIT